MERLFEYRDELLYCHHTLDRHPRTTDHAVHAHEKMEIYYLISGTGTFLIEGSQYALHAGDILLMRTAETHKLLVDEGQPYERISIHFAPELLDWMDPDGQLLRAFTARPLGQLNQYTPGDFHRKYWQAAFEDFDFAASAHVRAHIIARIAVLLPELCDAYDRRCGQILPVRGAAAQLVTLVNEHLFEELSIPALASAFYCSPSQVNRLFRQATGTSVKQYILMKRLLSARSMLQRGDSAGMYAALAGLTIIRCSTGPIKSSFPNSPAATCQGQAPYQTKEHSIEGMRKGGTHETASPLGWPFCICLSVYLFSGLRLRDDDTDAVGDNGYGCGFAQLLRCGGQSRVNIGHPGHVHGFDHGAGFRSGHKITACLLQHACQYLRLPLVHLRTFRRYVFNVAGDLRSVVPLRKPAVKRLAAMPVAKRRAQDDDPALAHAGLSGRHAFDGLVHVLVQGISPLDVTTISDTTASTCDSRLLNAQPWRCAASGSPPRRQ